MWPVFVIVLLIGSSTAWQGWRRGMTWLLGVGWICLMIGGGLAPAVLSHALNADDPVYARQRDLEWKERCGGQGGIIVMDPWMGLQCSQP